MSGNDGVIVITGAGGMGEAIARRLGAGSTVLLADYDQGTLASAAQSLRDTGHNVAEQVVDVSDEESVRALASAAAELGRVTTVVHTAGVSPVQASVEAILRVDLLGTALMLDAFGEVIASGGAGVVIASMAGHMLPQEAAFETALATTPTAQLLALPELGKLDNPGIAYCVAKRANHLRVKAASVPWGRRGARVNSISPGVIATPMGAAELASETGEGMRQMIKMSGTGRIGTPDDIAGAVAFLSGPAATFITGTDLLVDGGVVAALQAPTA